MTFTAQYGTHTISIEADSLDAAIAQALKTIKKQHHPKGVAWRRYVQVAPA